MCFGNFLNGGPKNLCDPNLLTFYGDGTSAVCTCRHLKAKQAERARDPINPFGRSGLSLAEADADVEKGLAFEGLLCGRRGTHNTRRVVSIVVNCTLRRLIKDLFYYKN